MTYIPNMVTLTSERFTDIILRPLPVMERSKKANRVCAALIVFATLLSVSDNAEFGINGVGGCVMVHQGLS